jgi:dCTP diphosphatase
MSVEAAELMEEFQWLASEESSVLQEDEAKSASPGQELADTIICCLNSANSLETDVSRAVIDKLAKNGGRYPEDQYSGRYSARSGREKE